MPARSVSAAQPVRRSGTVFINVPFDASYEPMLIALVAGLVTLGLKPRSVLEEPENSADRLSRLKNLIRGCDYSVHDLSCRTARFNMPFELGLALGLHDGAKHNWVVFDRKPHVLKKALSDLDGYDVVHPHGRNPRRFTRASPRGLSEAGHRAE